MQVINEYILFVVVFEIALTIRIFMYRRNSTFNNIVKEMIITNILFAVVFGIVYLIKYRWKS
ncbi:MAG: hypothetical protein CVV02_11500 [Firmicutes bacterium HGW-Firmicutes-7]|nr:MAG: hypothetical protein CVV02_11500 [Firmicutes bacterium HGW-Firmicutes-7]